MPTATLSSAPAARAPAARAVAEAPAGRARLVAQLLALLPLPVLAAVALGPADIRGALLEPDPGLLGLPALALLVGITVAWTLAGLLVVRHARSPVGQSLTLMLFTIPATVAAVVWPLVLVGTRGAG